MVDVLMHFNVIIFRITFSFYMHRYHVKCILYNVITFIEYARTKICLWHFYMLISWWRAFFWYLDQHFKTDLTMDKWINQGTRFFSWNYFMHSTILHAILWHMWSGWINFYWHRFSFKLIYLFWLHKLKLLYFVRSVSIYSTNVMCHSYMRE